MLLQVHRHGFEGQGALLKIHGQQVFPADLAAVFNGLFKVQGIVMRVRDNLAVDSAGQGFGLLLTHPFTGNKAFKN